MSVDARGHVYVLWEMLPRRGQRAIVNSSLKEDERSRVWLIRGAAS